MWGFDEKKNEEAEDGVDVSDMGCRISGKVPLTKIEGKLLIIPYTSAMGAMGQLIEELDSTLNFSHYIHHLSFGRDYPGMYNPLSNTSQLALAPLEHYSYFLSILSTTYHDRVFDSQHLVNTHRYVINGFRGEPGYMDRANPGLFFRYSYEPLAMILGRDRLPFMEFVIDLLAIIGGVFVSSGVVYNLVKIILRFALDLLPSRRSKRREKSKRFDGGWSPVLPQSAIAKSAAVTNNDTAGGVLSLA